ncbi:MAG: hypothetical protein IPM81_02040 [Saprospirales bacterium]|nr:hypothetical protein [Saprospirales bacterium]
MKHLQTGEVKAIQLDRGLDAIVEKKRMELAEILATGNVGATGGPGAATAPAPPQDNVSALLNRARQLLPNMPQPQRTEVENAIRQLETARSNNNPNEMGAALVNLTMLLM